MAAQMHINTLVANMFDKGLVDDQFQQLLMLQAKSAPGFIAEVVTLLYKEGWEIFYKLDDMLNKPCVDFNKVAHLLYKLMGSFASVGARRVKNICIQLLEFCQEKSIDGCLKTLDILRNEFIDMCIKLKIIVEMEKLV